MTSVTTKPDSPQPQSDTVHLFDDWFDPIEAGVRDLVRDFIFNDARFVQVRLPRRPVPYN